MRKFQAFFSVFVCLFFAGCATAQKNTKNQSIRAGEIAPDSFVGFACQENEETFAEHPEFFEDQDYALWCQECVRNNGVPSVGSNGPFCDYKTKDQY